MVTATLSLDEYLQTKYRKHLKNLDIRKFAVITLKFEQGYFTITLCVQKIQMEWHEMQTLGAVWSGSALFAKTCQWVGWRGGGGITPEN